MMSSLTFKYRGKTYPEYLRHGNAMQFVLPFAQYYCRGKGLDVGAGKWPLPGAKPVDSGKTENATKLPKGPWDFIFSSHCLEHLINPVAALEHWRQRLRGGGVLFLYLPHPDMEYWRPENCRKHLHLFWPQDMAARLQRLGFVNVLQGERDLMWSFTTVAWKPRFVLR